MARRLSTARSIPCSSPLFTLPSWPAQSPHRPSPLRRPATTMARVTPSVAATGHRTPSPARLRVWGCIAGVSQPDRPHLCSFWGGSINSLQLAEAWLSAGSVGCRSPSSPQDGDSRSWWSLVWKAVSTSGTPEAAFWRATPHKRQIRKI